MSAEQDARLFDATKVVVEELGLMWPVECESMHVDIARAVLKVADRHHEQSQHTRGCNDWPGPKCICAVGGPDGY